MAAVRWVAIPIPYSNLVLGTEGTLTRIKVRYYRVGAYNLIFLLPSYSTYVLYYNMLVLKRR